MQGTDEVETRMKFQAETEALGQNPERLGLRAGTEGRHPIWFTVKGLTGKQLLSSPFSQPPHTERLTTRWLTPSHERNPRLWPLFLPVQLSKNDPRTIKVLPRPHRWPHTGCFHFCPLLTSGASPLKRNNPLVIGRTVLMVLWHIYIFFWFCNSVSKAGHRN